MVRLYWLLGVAHFQQDLVGGKLGESRKHGPRSCEKQKKRGNLDNTKVMEHRRKNIGKGQPGPFEFRNPTSEMCMIYGRGMGKEG